MQMYFSSYTTPPDGHSLRGESYHRSCNYGLWVLSRLVPAGRRFLWSSSPFSSLAAAKSFRQEVASWGFERRDECFNPCRR